MIFSFFANFYYFGVNSHRGRLLDGGRLLEEGSNTILTAFRRRSQEQSWRGRGEGEKRKEGLTQNHSANRVITHNTPWRHRPQLNTIRAIGKEKPLKFFIDVLISCGTFMGRETQRGSHKGSRERFQVLSWNKNKPRTRIVFSKPRH